MVAIPFPLTHSPGLRTAEGAGRLYNCYAEPMGEGGRGIAVLHRSPGLVNFATSDFTTFRGGTEVGGVLFLAYSGFLTKIGSGGGTPTTLGPLGGNRKGFFARNNAAVPDRWFVDPDGDIATFTDSGVVQGWPDADLPAVNSTCSIDGYGVFSTGDGRAFATGLNTTAVNALSFGTAESKPDGLLRVINWSGRLLMCGTQTIEVWVDAGLSPFPFARSDVIQIGIAGSYSITGFEDNFSKGVYFVGNDNCVYRLDGSSPTKISSADLEGLIEQVTDKNDIEMCSYISRGHPFVQISSSSWSWVFDISTGKWHERPSYLEARSRITQSFYAFGKWLCGDVLSGGIHQIQTGIHKEVTSPLICEVWSAPVQKFPQHVRVASMWFDFTVGVGIATGSDPNESNPRVEISWSDDGGVTWSIPRICNLGRQSQGRTRVRINQCGKSGSQGRIVKVRMSDPVHFGLMGGEMSTELRAS